VPRKSLFLHIDDDENEVFFVAREFAKAPSNVTVRAVTSAREAVKYLKGEGRYQDRLENPLPVLILLDLKMPLFDGFDFLTWLRGNADEHLRLIPVIVLSVSNLPEDVAKAYRLGANSYMRKPLEWTEFAERIKTLGVYWTEHVEIPQPLLVEKAPALRQPPSTRH
jgi:CheY-like chemotaxis protein